MRGRVPASIRMLALGAVAALAAWQALPAARASDRPGIDPTGPPGESAGTVLFRGATVWTMGPDGVVEADVLIRDGKIARIGPGLNAPAGAAVVEARGKHVTPGLIDAHSHSAVDGGVNEGANNVTAEVRIADVLDPLDINIYRQLAGGLTAANVLHGSANSIGGQNAVIKLRRGVPADGLLFEGAPPGIKFALGENPKRSNFSTPGRPPRYPTSRMGVEASIREAFRNARQYAHDWKEYRALSSRERARTEPPRRDLQMEALVEVLEGKRLVHSHCYRQDEILMLMRIAEDFGFRIATFQHVLEGYKVADELAAHGAGASTFSDWWAFKFEAYDAIPYNGSLMADRGVVVSFNSDSSELARRMNLEAAKAVKYGGQSEEDSLAFVTINPAKQLGIDRWVGSLEPGKHADLVVWSGHPLSVYAIAEQTWVDGVKQFDRAEDLDLREEREARRAALMERVAAADTKKKDESGEEKEGEKAEAAEAEEEPGEAGEGAPDETSAGEASSKDPQPAPRRVDYRLPAGVGRGVTALTGATVHPVSGPEISNGTIVIRDGKIADVGRSVSVPPGADVVNLTGLHVWPGLIEADTVLGLTEIGSVRGSVDTSESGTINPEVRVEIAVNPDSELIPVTRANGITHVLTAPRGNLVNGTSALIRLDGWTWEDHAASAPVAMHVRYPRWLSGPSFFGPSLGEEELKKRREEALEQIETLFDDARAYRKAKEAAATGAPRPLHDRKLEAMIPVIDGVVPVVVHATEVRQIRHAVDWAEKEGVRMILAGGRDAWRVADRLAEREIPVLLGPVLSLPSRRHEPYDTPFTTPTKLREAGVQFAITGGGSSFGASNARNLPYHAAMAAAHGLPHDEAVRAITLAPAEILGVADQLGSIEPGKSASLMVTDGDPLEIRTQVKRLWIDGKEVDLMNKHRRLYERYRQRPRAN